MRSILILALGFIFITQSSCFSPKPLQFKKVDQVKVDKNGSDPQFNFLFQFHNPNGFGLRISRMDMQLFLDQKQVGFSGDTNTIHLARKSDFTVPLNVHVSMNDLQKVLPLAITMLFDKSKSIPVSVKGEMVLRKFIFKKKFAFEINEKIDASMLKSFF